MNDDAIHQVPNDRLLDHAQGRLTPGELAEISRQMSEDPSLQQRYAEIRRLRRLVRERYRPTAVARPDGRDEEMAGLISGFVDAIRNGVMLPTAEQAGYPAELAAIMQGDADDSAAGASARYDYDDSPSSAGNVISGPWLAPAESAPMSAIVVDGAHAPGRLRTLRRVAGYGAAAAVLLMAAWWSIGTDDPLVSPSRSSALQPKSVVIREASEPAVAVLGPASMSPVSPIDRGQEVGVNTTAPSPTSPTSPTSPDVIQHTERDTATDTQAPAAGAGNTDNPPADVADSGDNSSNVRPAPAPEDGSEFMRERASRMFADSGASLGNAGGNNSGTAASGSRLIVGRTELLGDVDGNGVVDDRDYRRLLEHVLASDAHTLGLAVADINGDNTIDTRDLASLRSMTAASARNGRSSD
ncbi:MAG: dockerin type I repeat-containing protein [Planctomycetota bacterium]